MSATLGSLARLRLLGGRVEAHHEPDAGRVAALPYPSLQGSGEELQPLPCADGKLPEKRVTVELVDPGGRRRISPHRRRPCTIPASCAFFLYVSSTGVDDADRVSADVGPPAVAG